MLENDGLLIQNNGSTPVLLWGPSMTATGSRARVQVAANAVVTVSTTGAEPLALYGVVATEAANVSYLFPG